MLARMAGSSSTTMMLGSMRSAVRREGFLLQLLDGNVPPGFDVPIPRMSDELTADEDPLEGNEETPLEMHLPEPGQEPDQT